jgi:hypothetical protein
MGLNERERASRFHKAIVIAIGQRFAKQRKSKPARLHDSRCDTWAKTLIRNRSKLKPRLAEPLKERRRNSEWDYVIAKQKIRMNKVLDPYVRWAARERSILDQVNERGFVQAECLARGFNWTYVAAKQVEKMMLNRLPALLTPRMRRTDWPGARMRIWAEYKRLMNTPPAIQDSWEPVIKGTRRKFNQELDDFADWGRANGVANQKMEWRKTMSTGVSRRATAVVMGTRQSGHSRGYAFASSRSVRSEKWAVLMPANFAANWCFA